MTKDEALDLALETLEQYTNVVTSANDPYSWETVADGGKPARDAITAIKQARALDKMAENARELGLDYEPVAWRWVNPKGWLTYGEKPHDTFKSTPLYTTPPAAQRQWVGLAEADKHKPDMGGYVYLNDDWLDGYKTGMEYAEAILKEKNA